MRTLQYTLARSDALAVHEYGARVPRQHPMRLWAAGVMQRRRVGRLSETGGAPVGPSKKLLKLKLGEEDPRVGFLRTLIYSSTCHLARPAEEHYL